MGSFKWDASFITLRTVTDKLGSHVFYVPFTDGGNMLKGYITVKASAAKGITEKPLVYDYQKDYINNASPIKKLVTGNALHAFGAKGLDLPEGFENLQAGLKKQANNEYLNNIKHLKNTLQNVGSKKANDVNSPDSAPQCVISMLLNYTYPVGSTDQIAYYQGIINDHVARLIQSEYFPPITGVQVSLTSDGITFIGPGDMLHMVTPYFVMNILASEPGVADVTFLNESTRCDTGTYGGSGDGAGATITDNITGFPCASVLIIDSLRKIPAYATLIQPFNTPQKPNLTYTNSNLDWGISSGNSLTYKYGETLSSSMSNSSSTITLNSKMLSNSSQLLITGVTIHETLHAVINYNIVWAGYNLQNGDSWMADMNSWYLLNGLPSNFSNHYEMMDYYFYQAVGILASWDNNQHTANEYVMTMLIGLNNPGTDDGSTTYAARAQLLQSEYDSIKTKNQISDTDLSTFQANQTNASQTIQLPKSGCN